jgi:hypothetical protein
MDDEVETEKTVDRLLHDSPTEEAVVFRARRVGVGEHRGDVGAGRPEGAERIILD